MRSVDAGHAASRRVERISISFWCKKRNTIHNNLASLVAYYYLLRRRALKLFKRNAPPYETLYYYFSLLFTPWVCPLHSLLFIDTIAGSCLPTKCWWLEASLRWLLFTYWVAQLLYLMRLMHGLGVRGLPSTIACRLKALDYYHYLVLF